MGSVMNIKTSLPEIRHWLVHHVQSITKEYLNKLHNSGALPPVHELFKRPTYFTKTLKLWLCRCLVHRISLPIDAYRSRVLSLPYLLHGKGYYLES